MRDVNGYLDVEDQGFVGVFNDDVVVLQNPNFQPGQVTIIKKVKSHGIFGISVIARTPSGTRAVNLKRIYLPPADEAKLLSMIPR